MLDMLALGLMVSEKKFLKVHQLYSSIRANDPLGCGQFGPRGLIGRNYVGDHETLLKSKYVLVNRGPHGFSEVDFLKCFPLSVYGS